MARESTVTVHCDGIMCESEVEISLPDGWSGDTETGGDGHWTYCPKCKAQEDYFSSVCPGCVESYSDCALGKAFLFCNNRMLLTDKDFEVILSGKCPKRTNGTFMVNNGYGFGIEQINISDSASKESGIAVANAIKMYIIKYGQQNRVHERC